MSVRSLTIIHMTHPSFKRGLVAGLILSAVLCALPGCGPTRAVVLDTRGVRPEVDYGDLAAVLERAICEDGKLKPSALKEAVARLDAQLKLLAVTGPTVTPALLPRAEDRLAYWCNARAAWCMKLALSAGTPETLRARELEDRPFPLDGRTMTLREIDAVLSAGHGWLATVAAPGVRAQRARLPGAPFTAASVRAELRKRFGQFIDDADRFVIDVEGRRILVPPVLCRFRSRLIEDYHKRNRTEGATLTTALLGWVTGSAHRRLQDAVGYTCAPARRRDDIAVCRDD